jgi:hypothetical protein
MKYVKMLIRAEFSIKSMEYKFRTYITVLQNKDIFPRIDDVYIL